MTSVATLDRSADTTARLHPLLAERWSPRGFDATHRVDDETVTALLEAARWAPSANNSQPWRFVVGHRGDDTFAQVLDLLAPFNQVWARSASALVVAVAQTTDETGDPRPWALYDTGQAVAAMTMQGEAEGLSLHQMGGFDADGVHHRFGLTDDLTPVVVVAVGRHDPRADLPEPLAARETAPRTREPLSALLLLDGR
jgi:nitroreductase